MVLVETFPPSLATKARKVFLANFRKLPKILRRIRFETDPETTSRHISGTVRDIATKLQTGIPNVTVYLLAISVSIASINGLFFGELFTGFCDFLKANKSETAQDNRLKLRLLRGLSCISICMCLHL
jgi:hypothetical protein